MQKKKIKYIKKSNNKKKNIFTVNNYIDISNNNIIKKTIFIISNVTSGYSYKYIQDIKKTFETNKTNFEYIKIYNDLINMENKIKENDIILLQYLINTDIKIGLLIETLIRIKMKINIKVILTIHDFYYLNDTEKNLYIFNENIHSLYFEKNKPLKECFDLINLTDKIIIPSLYAKEIFEKKFNIQEKIIICPYIDYNLNSYYINIPKIINKTINICVPHEILNYNGKEYYNILFEIKNYKDYNINYHIFTNNKLKILSKNNTVNTNIICHKSFNDDDLYDILKKNNIHILAFLNKFGETYSYSLTKAINSGLPILYNNIGDFRERIPFYKKYFPINNVINISSINLNLNKCINFVIFNKENNEYKDSYKIIPELYKNIFGTNYTEVLLTLYNKNKYIYEKIYEKIEPYAIYFPQFHSIYENNMTFYEGFHDIINLERANKKINKYQTPLNSLLGLYNLKYDNEIIKKQIEIAKSYCIKGFGIYYYWFSNNNITNNNMIMKDVIDKFFTENIDNFDIFFIWANENWSNNQAFNQFKNNYVIKNIYNEENIIKNINNLISYFKHKNYKKIDNKPVFFIHHPWLINKNEFNLFINIANNICIKNGFSGIEISTNSIGGKIKEYVNYHHHANYKTLLNNNFIKKEKKIKYLDYKLYIDSYLPLENIEENLNDIHTIFTNFDNSVRLYNHKIKNITITKTTNNNLFEFSRFLNIQLSKYQKKNTTNKISKIFLINAWNEWGEQMVLEPSNELGFAYLETFLKEIIKV